MNREELTNKCWKYYLMLEERVIHTEKYVEICEENKNTFSIEYAMLLQAIGVEIDSFLFYRPKRLQTLAYFF